VKVWLDQNNYRRGDKAHVNVELGEHGYLVVLRADANHRVRVLFPLDRRRRFVAEAKRGRSGAR